MTQSPSHVSWVFRAPPGMRFTIWGSDVHFEFERGRELEAIVSVLEWLESHAPRAGETPRADHAPTTGLAEARASSRAITASEARERIRAVAREAFEAMRSSPPPAREDASVAALSASGYAAERSPLVFTPPPAWPHDGRETSPAPWPVENATAAAPRACESSPLDLLKAELARLSGGQAPAISPVGAPASAPPPTRGAPWPFAGLAAAASGAAEGWTAERVRDLANASSRQAEGALAVFQANTQPVVAEAADAAAASAEVTPERAAEDLRKMQEFFKIAALAESENRAKEMIAEVRVAADAKVRAELAAVLEEKARGELAARLEEKTEIAPLSPAEANAPTT